MSVVPSPVPHPLEFSPFDVPAWAYEALEWVVGFDWPAGDEVATWDVADRWFLLATTLAEPNEAAMSAAGRFLSGYGGEGITAAGFEDAWRLVAGDDSAPLHDLLRVSGELGRLVENCGADIEAAKLEAWIEIGIFLVELVAMAVTVAFTLGAASPAAGGLIVATRLAIQQIFRRLVEQLGAKALRQTAGRAVKQVTSREGLQRLGRQALDEGFDEASEEIAINSGIQLYQQSNGRSDFDVEELGRNALAGFAGGAAATGSQIGSHGHHGGVLRGAGGEVLAEFGAAATFGELPDAAGLAKSATSGGVGAALHTPSTIDIGQLSLSEPFIRTPDSVEADVGRTPVSGLGAGPVISAEADGGRTLVPAPAVAHPSVDVAPSSLSSPTTLTSAPLDPSSPSLPAESSTSSSSPAPPPESSTRVEPSASAAASSPSFSGSATPSLSSSSSSDFAAPSSFSSSSDFAMPSPSSSADFATPSPSFSDSVTPSPSDGSSILASTATAGFADPITAASVSSPSPATPVSADPVPGQGFPGVGARPTGPSGSARSSLSDLERIAEALGPRQPARRHSGFTSAPSRRTPEPTPWARTAPPSVRPEVHDERAYFGYADHARRTHEQNRRDEYAAYLDAINEDNRGRILDLGRRADEASRVGFTLREAQYRHQARELSEIIAETEDQITRIRSGELAPDRVEVDPPEWARINHDVGNLAPGGVRTGDRSALDGLAGRPPIDRTRHYNVTGGLRPPLAVHQVDIENAVPRDPDGSIARLPDPREGTWFRLANDGGPAADPTRALNCTDGVLALFDTYIHGRPRVSAPRTFDVYAHGNPDRPLGGEVHGIDRIRLATGGDFQSLCPYVGDATPQDSKPAVDHAVRNLTNHLLNTGHGAYAFLVTDLEGGGSHSWAALNHNGTVLFVDPQIGRISENTPLYQHHGVPTPVNVVSLEALVVNAAGTPTPLPHHGPGTWSATPTGAEPNTPETPTQRAERLAVDSLTEPQRAFLDRSLELAEAKAEEVSRDLHRIVASLAGPSTSEPPMIVGEAHRVKELGSLARKFLTRVKAKRLAPEDALASIKDRVRFSVQLPRERYGESVRAIIAGLQHLGYRPAPLENFWAPHGRHNGMNVNVTAPDGFVLEVQFPTRESLQVGHKTHVRYEEVRDDSLAPELRVESFLAILKINKESGIYQEQPLGLNLLGSEAPVDTTLARWLADKRGLAAAYREHLAATNTTFEDVLQRYGLGLEDVPGIERLGLISD